MSDILAEKLNSLKNNPPPSAPENKTENKPEQDQEPKKKGPGGVVLGKDGKPFVYLLLQIYIYIYMYILTSTTAAAPACPPPTGPP